jgi:hypothetical protein
MTMELVACQKPDELPAVSAYAAHEAVEYILGMDLV